MRMRNSLAVALLATGMIQTPTPCRAEQACAGTLLDERIQMSRAAADAGDLVALHCVGLALVESQELGRALPYLQRLAGSCPASLEVSNNLAIALAGAGDRARAVAELERLVDPQALTNDANADVVKRNRKNILAIDAFWRDTGGLPGAESLNLELIDSIDSCLPTRLRSDGGSGGGAQEAATEPTSGDEGDEDPVFDAVAAWAGAWQDQDLAGYFAAYSSRFTPADGSRRAAWERLRTSRIETPDSIELELDEYEDDPISEALVEVRFLQVYRSSTFSDTVRKTLRLTLENGAWKILSEFQSLP